VLRALTLALAVLAATAGGASARAGGGTEEAYVAVEDEGLVVSVMLDTGEVTSRISVASPRHVAVGSERRLVLVSSPSAGRVTAIDSFRHRKVGSFTGLGSPEGIEIVGRYAYVADAERGEIVVLDLDLETWRIAGRVRVGGRPFDIAVGEVGLVAHGSGRDQLTVLDLSRPAAPRVVDTRASGGRVVALDGRPGTASAFVAYRSGAVAALDWRRGTVRWRRLAGSGLRDVTRAYGDTLWVTDANAGNVLALRSTDGRVLRRLRRCPGSRGVHFGPGRGHIVAACHDAGTLLVLDPVSEHASRIPVGAGPQDVAVAYVP
jgi:DNA-binding beta-propeller fold protein YncE